MARIAPRVKIMLAAMARLKEADLQASTGLADLVFRFARNRYATREERPCISLAFVSDGPVDAEGGGIGGGVLLNPEEALRALSLDIIVDLDIETEASAEANEQLATPPEDYDPTGLNELSIVLDDATLALRSSCIPPLQDTTDLGKMVDWVSEVVVDDDEELAGEDGRLVGRLNMVYRTSSWDPTHLFERA